MLAICSAILALLLGAPAHAATPFAPIPADQTGGNTTGLEMRVVDYSGSVNGVIEVEVKNPTSQPVEFTAKGIYFVPDGNADRAPQRLGAVGQFLVQTGKTWQRAKMTSIPAAASAHLKLDVYCIDSHRGSPSSTTSFHLAKTRMPHQVFEAIDHDSAAAAALMGGVSAPAAKSTVQSEVWKDRDAHWVPLDGEGKQEEGKAAQK